MQTPILRLLSRLPAWSIFAVLSLAITLPRLFSGEWVFGKEGADITLQFLSWREFGFAEMSQGNFPLWNPYIFCGVPYFAGFQSALLYPPNFLHLIFSPAVAINWIVAIHLFLAGYLFFRWCIRTGTSQPGAVLAGVCWMFSGPFYLRVFAGHLSILCVIPWLPLLWEAIDDVFRETRARAVLKGSFALAMMILAGHPQYVYFAGLVTAVYVVLKLFDRASWPARGKAFASCMAIVFIGSTLTTVQWLTALDANQEFVRSAGLEYKTAASFSLPPENLWTLAAPGLLGSLSLGGENPIPPGYFGRAYLWEVSLFISVTGCILAGIGGIHRTFILRDWKWLVLLIVSLTLALGAHTPVHRLLFDYLPGFGSFRGVTKFSFLAVMILCKLAADGWDVVRQQRAWRISIGTSGISALLLLLLTLVAFNAVGKGKGSFWAVLLRDHLEAAIDVEEAYIDMKLLASPAFFDAAARVSANSAMLATLTALMVTAGIVATRWKPKLTHALPALAAMEMLLFAFSNRALSSADRSIPEAWKPAIAELPDDERILTPQWAQEDWSMSWRVPNVWGYDPNVQLRFAQLLYASQGLSPDAARNYIAFRSMPAPVGRMLRVGAILLNHGSMPAIKQPNPLPVTSLVSLPFVIKDRDELLRLVLSNEFDPQFSIALESPPPFELSRSFDPGEVKVLNSGTDFLEIEANVKAASFLLITESYSRHWKVRSVLSPQATFEVMPANWALMGVPLKAGRHHLRLEYAPASFTIGAWVSGISTSAFLAVCVWQIFSRRRAASSDNSQHGFIH